MSRTSEEEFIIGRDSRILITGATGFIGSRLAARLLERGFRNLRCLGRPSGKMGQLEALCQKYGDRAQVEFFRGNLLSREDCAAATRDAEVIFHLAAGTGDKSFPGAFMNSVVTTRNLIEASHTHGCLRRFVSTSSFTVYTNNGAPRKKTLDESAPVEQHPEKRCDAYSFAKIRQDELVTEYGRRLGIPYVIVRPGYVYGPGKRAITGRVGVDTFGIFLHLGGSNTIPFTHVDNCAEAVALAGLTRGVDREVFNVVDDDLPSSREFLRKYKRQVRNFKSVYIPHALSFALCCLWEKYSEWSEGQLPPAFNRADWYVSWKKTRYTNEKIKRLLGWKPVIATGDGLQQYFEACRESFQHA